MPAAEPGGLRAVADALGGTRRIVGGGFTPTVLSRVLAPRRSAALAGARSDYVRVAPNAALRLRVHGEPGCERLVLLVHGYTGSSDSSSVRRAALQALAHGFAVARVDLRNAGGTHHLCDGLFNLDQWSDLGPVVRHLQGRSRPRALYGLAFSLGGSALVNLLARAPEHQAAFAGAMVVNAPLDIPAAIACVNSARNRFYARSFLARLLRDVEIKRRLGATYPDPRGLRCRTMPEYDAHFVLSETAHPSLHRYYEQASAAPHLHAIGIPLAILASRDDPLVPAATFSAARVGARTEVVLVDRGGHVGYLEWQDRRLRSWAAEVALRYFGGLGARSGGLDGA